MSHLRGQIEVGFRFPVLHQFTPRAVAQASDTIQRRWTEFQPVQLQPFELKPLWTRVKNAWLHDKGFDAIVPKDRRRLPAVVFLRPDKTSEPLAADSEFSRALKAWLERSDRASMLGRLLSEFLANYPNDLKTCDAWRAWLQGRLTRTTSARLNTWKQRCAKYSLLEPDGVARFPRLVLQDERPVTTVIEDAGFSGVLATSRFLTCSALSAVRAAGVEIQKENATLERMNRLFKLLAPSGKLQFEIIRKEVGDELLLPFAGDSDVPEPIRAAVQGFMLQAYGDPRQRPDTAWQRVSIDARNVMMSWLVRATLQDFFRLIDRTAYTEHWEARKKFWKKYLSRGHVSDAWIVLGPTVAWHAGGDRNTVRYGSLRGGYDASHTALIMRIRGLTIVEWSHNGKCRMWESGSRRAPRPYLAAYTRSQLVDDPDFEQAHHSGWQSSVAEYIEEETGAR